MAFFTTNLEMCLSAVTAIIACGTLLSSLQWIANRRALTNDGVLSWSILSTRRAIWSRGWMVSVATPVLDDYGMMILLAARVSAAAALLTFPHHLQVRPLCLTVLVVTTFAMHLRSFPLGFSGADRMRLIVLGALFLRELAPHSDLATQACVWFIALQCCLSYVTAGLVKLSSADWRAGEVLPQVFCCHLFRHEKAATFLKQNPAASKSLSWMAMLLLTSFPLSLFDTRVCAIYLAAMFLFHIANAILLGFNKFVWSWAATYPAVFYVATVIS